MEEKISLKSFLEAVEQRISACSSDELRTILRRMAEETSPTGRQKFLQKLELPAERMTPFQTPVQGNLLDKIAGMEAEMQEAIETAEPDEYDEYEENWYGEDDEEGDEEGEDHYEDFYEPLSGLFDQAQAAFDYGDLALARDAYEGLFELCSQEDEYGGGIQTERIPDFDQEEALARYLFAVYAIAPIEKRPEQLFEAMSLVHAWSGKPLMFENLMQISLKPLPDLEAFWPEWIALLQEKPGSDADAWLREAVRLTQGTAGLATLARASGAEHPRAYLDWLAALLQEKRYAEALAVAQEALQALPSGLPIRAAVADYLCTAALRVQDIPALRAGRWEAFTAAPDLSRLLDVRDAAPSTERIQVMQQAYQYLQEYQKRPRDPSQPVYYGDDLERPTWISQSLLAHALLLSGGWESAYLMASKEPVLGWSSSENTQGLVVAFFLVWLSGKTTSLPRSLAALWQQRLQTIEYTIETESATVKRLKAAYAELFSQISLDAAQQANTLNWCLATANRRVDEIVSGLHRGSYDKAAMLITACAEVLRLRGENGRASDLLADVRARYPRHRAFQAEMNKAGG